MNRLVELGQLMDWYGAFLTERQRSLVRQYAYEDRSLGEIAEREGISRQAVRDAILTAESELKDMEAKLSLIDTNEKPFRLDRTTRRNAAQRSTKRPAPADTELVSEEEDGV